MRKKLINLIMGVLLLVALVAMPVLASCKPVEVSPPTPSLPVKPTAELIVGNLADISGPTVSTNVPLTEAFEEYCSYINDTKGGIEGKKGVVKLKVITLDTKYELAKGKEAWERLKEDGMQVCYIALSGLIEGLYLDAEKDKIPFMAGSVGAKSVYGEWVFLGSHNGTPNMITTAATGIVETCKWEGKGVPQMGFLSVDIPMSTIPIGYPGTLEYIEERWGELPIELFPSGTTDVTAQITRLKDKGVTELISLNDPVNIVVTLQSMRRMGLTPDKMRLWLPYHANPSDVIKLGGVDLVEGHGNYVWFMPPAKTPTIPDPPGLVLAKQLWDKDHAGKPLSELFVFPQPQVLIMEEAIRLCLDEFEPAQITGERLKVYGFERIRDFPCGGLIDSVTYKPGVLPHDYGVSNSFWIVRDGVLYPSIGDELTWIKCTQVITPPE